MEIVERISLLVTEGTYVAPIGSLAIRGNGVIITAWYESSRPGRAVRAPGRALHGVSLA